MTPKQIEKIQSKIKQIRSTLAAEKSEFGVYDDSRGLRYLPLHYYIRIQDYKGGLNYTRWFQKNFPDDIGFPEFHFEWTIILFKLRKFKEAERMALKTYFSNTYLFDKFFNRPIIQIDKWEWSNWEGIEIANELQYNCDDKNLRDFSEWLENLEQSERFRSKVDRFIEIQKALKDEESTVKRRQLGREADQLLEDF